MKRIGLMLSLLLAVVLLVTVFSCAGPAPSPTPTPTQTPTSTPTAKPTPTTTQTPTPTSTASPTPTTALKPIKLKAASYGGPTYPHRLAFERAMDTITKKSDGLITFDYYPGGALFNLPQAFHGIGKGLADLGITYAGETSTGLMGPLFYTNTPPFAFDPVKFQKHWRDPGGYKDIAEIYWATNNLREIAHPRLEWNHPPMRVPIYKLEDWKGKLIRSTGGLRAGVQGLGAEPVTMPLADVYEGLQRKTIDGALSSLSNYVDNKMWEVAKYIIECGLYSGHLSHVMNLKTYKSLDPKFQKIIDDAFYEAEVWINATRATDFEKERKLAESNGTIFIKIPADELARWRAASQKLWWDTIAKEFAPAEIEKWKKIVDSLS